MNEPIRRAVRRLVLMTTARSGRTSFFFVRGHMRSGTNWIGNLLNLHPKINCTGEFHLQRLKRPLDEMCDPSHSQRTFLASDLIRDSAKARFEQFVRQCIVDAAVRQSTIHTRLYGDRTPSPIEPLLLQGCRHILAVRDLRDALVSLTYHFLKPQEWHFPFEDFPQMLAKRAAFSADASYFNHHPHELLDDERWVRCRAASWSERVQQDLASLQRAASGELDASIHVVRYEQLLSDTERLRNEMYEFLGVDPRKAAPLDERTSPGFEREDPQSHYRKGAAGDWRKYFTAETCRWVKEEAGEQLIALGYEQNDRWS